MLLSKIIDLYNRSKKNKAKKVTKKTYFEQKEYIVSFLLRKEPIKKLMKFHCYKTLAYNETFLLSFVFESFKNQFKFLEHDEFCAVFDKYSQRLEMELNKYREQHNKSCKTCNQIGLYDLWMSMGIEALINIQTIDILYFECESITTEENKLRDEL